MLLKDLNNNIKPFSIAYSLKGTPHLSLETNFTCNLTCKACYNKNKDHVKSLSKIQEEIKFAMTKRNLETISVIGGEPTLHPNLIDIIKFIRKQGIFCQVLSNGIIFLEDDEDTLLKECINAGVNRIVVHVDEGQKHYHKDIKSVIVKLFNKLEKYKIPYALTVTIYNETTSGIPENIKEYMGYKYFDGVIGYVVRDVSQDIAQKTQSEDNPKLEDVYQSISNKLHIEPSAYLPSGMQEDYISWMIYLFFINTKTQETFSISPGILKFGRKIYKMRTGKNPVGGFYSRRTFRLSIIVMFFLETLNNVKSFKAFWKLMKKSSGLKNIRQLFITLQNPPEFDKEKGTYHICHHCPDATVRNGKLMPLCMADFISPIDEKSAFPPEFSEERKQVTEIAFRHLEEE